MKSLWDIFVNRLFQNVQVVFVIFGGRWESFMQFRNVFSTTSGTILEKPSFVFL